MILLSYRRTDSTAVAGRLYDRLQARFGQSNVLMDSDANPAGIDLHEHISATLDHADILIALIGPAWLGNEAATRRIDDPADSVRLEVSSALWRGIPVLPVLVEGAEMPGRALLPADIRQLALRDALPLDSGPDFHSQAERIIAGTISILPAVPRSGGVLGRRLMIILAIALVVFVGSLAIALQRKRPSSPPIPSSAVSPTPADSRIASTPKPLPEMTSPTPGRSTIQRSAIQGSSPSASPKVSPVKEEPKPSPPADRDPTTYTLPDFIGTWSSVTSNPIPRGGAITVHDQLAVGVDAMTETISTEWTSGETRVFRIVMKVRFTDFKLFRNQLDARCEKVDVTEVFDPEKFGAMSNIARQAEAATKAGIGQTYSWTLTGAELRRAETVWKKQN
ncbi:MAG: TIR domain-containing protein [Chthoniobacterales bacterium]